MVGLNSSPPHPMRLTGKAGSHRPKGIKAGARRHAGWQAWRVLVLMRLTSTPLQLTSSAAAAAQREGPDAAKGRIVVIVGAPATTTSAKNGVIRSHHHAAARVRQAAKVGVQILPTHAVGIAGTRILRHAPVWASCLRWRRQRCGRLQGGGEVI